jgi:hypothetical protein
VSSITKKTNCTLAIFSVLKKMNRDFESFPLLYGIVFYFYFESCQTCQEINTEDSLEQQENYTTSTPATFVTPPGWYAATRQSKQTPPKHMPELGFPLPL